MASSRVQQQRATRAILAVQHGLPLPHSGHAATLAATKEKPEEAMTAAAAAGETLVLDETVEQLRAAALGAGLTVRSLALADHASAAAGVAADGALLWRASEFEGVVCMLELSLLPAAAASAAGEGGVGEGGGGQAVTGGKTGEAAAATAEAVAPLSSSHAMEEQREEEQRKEEQRKEEQRKEEQMEQLRRSTRRSLLDRTGRAFTLRGDRVVLSPNGPASQSLGLLSECGEATCACCRAVDHRARPFFRRGVVNWAVALGFAPSVRYVSVGAGLLLTDAEIISGLIEGGATIESIQVRALRAMRKPLRSRCARVRCRVLPPRRECGLILRALCTLPTPCARSHP